MKGFIDERGNDRPACVNCKYRNRPTVFVLCYNCVEWAEEAVLEWLKQEAITGVDQGEEDIASQEYQAATEYQEYCERYEPTYNPEDGSM